MKAEEQMAKKRAGTKIPDWRKRISINPKVCHGKACVKGTRIMASIILDYLKAGEPVAEILRQYPTLTSQDVQAAVALCGLAGA